MIDGDNDKQGVGHDDLFEYTDTAIDSDPEFKKLMIAINHTDSGFICFTTPSAYGQDIIARSIKQKILSKPAAFWDGTIQTELISLTFFSDITKQNPDAEVFILTNFQLLAKDFERQKEFFYMLNLIRDPLAALKKLFVFGMTKDFARQFALYAPDFRSFFLANFQFEITPPERVVLESSLLSSEQQSITPSQFSVDMLAELWPSALEWLKKMFDSETPVLNNSILDFLEIWNKDLKFPTSEELNAILHILVLLRKIIKSQKDNNIQPNERLRIARELRIIAQSYKKLYKYDEENICLREAMQIIVDVQGEQSVEAAGIYNDIAINANYRFKYKKALGWYEKALVIDKLMFCMEHSATASIYNNMAVVYDSQGDYAKALELYEKALAIREQILGKEHHVTADSYFNIAGVYYNQHDYTKTMEWIEKALVIREMILGKEHPDTAKVYNNIALVYDEQGDYPKALEYYEKAITIREKVLGKEHPETAESYNGIAVVFSSQGDYSKALALFKIAYFIIKNVFGDNHPTTKIYYENSKLAYKKAGYTGDFINWLSN